MCYAHREAQYTAGDIICPECGLVVVERAIDVV